LVLILFSLQSTTLSILTGDIQPTQGEAYIAGLPLSDPSTRSLIGYCPQTDPLLDLMTGYETLWFFGRVRGIESVALHHRCLELIDQVGLTKHAFKPCGSYSGGNKRCLDHPIHSQTLSQEVVTRRGAHWQPEGPLSR
jgi:ATP-binding cassette, subfamily A (ABC1), member 3